MGLHDKRRRGVCRGNYNVWYDTASCGAGVEPRALRSPGWVKCRSHRRLSVERRRYVGHGNASYGAGGGPRVVNEAGQGGVPRHRCALGKRRRGRECRGVPRWRRPQMGSRYGPGPSGRWAPLGLQQRQKTTAGAARPAAGERALIDERAGPLDGGAAQAHTRKQKKQQASKILRHFFTWIESTL